jgi:hypothetical protein
MSTEARSVTSTPEEAEKDDKEKAVLCSKDLIQISYMALWRFCLL